MHFADWNTRSQRKRDQATDRLRIRHRRATSLAEIYEHLEWLTAIVLGDVEEHGAERRLDTRGDAAQSVGASALGAPLQVLRLSVEQRLLESRILGLELGDGAV